jgi:predicted MFS family arabinose efflux permease
MLWGPEAMLGSRFRQILRLPGTARLLLPALAGRIPDSIAATAIAVLVRSVTGSYPAAGLAAGSFGIGTAVSAPLAGRALDRLGQRRVLPVLAGAFAAALIVLVVAAGHLGTGAVVALAVAAGMARPPIEAGLRALWPRLVPAGRLDAAYALDSTLQELIWIGGPLLLALLLALGSPRLPLLCCALLSLAGTAAYATSPRLSGSGRATAGARSPLRSSPLRILLLASASYGAAAGILNLALVAYAATHGGVAWTGVLVAIWGVGSLAGGVAYGSRNWQVPVEWRAIGCLALFGAALVLLAAAPNLTVLALLMIPAGLPLSPWLGSLSASVQRAVPAATSTEAFTWTFAVITMGTAGGSALGGVITQGAGPQIAFLAAGALALTGAALGALWRPRTPGPVPAPSGQHHRLAAAAAAEPENRQTGPIAGQTAQDRQGPRRSPSQANRQASRLRPALRAAGTATAFSHLRVICYFCRALSTV